MTGGEKNMAGRLIRGAMQRIARRKPGMCRLVYDPQTRTIRKMGPQGKDLGDSGIRMRE